MKQDLHPHLYDVMARCACGNEFKTSSTRRELRSTYCSKCHPFFTGSQKHIDTAGRIEKFNKKYKV
ncbi:50S ribosomal protein L31 [Candidatus Dependentiae bacterium]|nr:50S ribosomal protein L31 [Candidatus Dependentiae bacterium]